MFSVIIPTMWRYKPFTKFLWDLVEDPLVGEVVIINNSVENTPNDLILYHDKVRMFNQENNIYVNPAWNLGVEKASYDQLCIANDDIVFDMKLFDRLKYEVTPENGAFGMVCGEPQFNQPLLTDGTLDITKCDTPYNYQTHFGFGQLMFVHKSNWTPIIPGLNIYWGDNYIYDTIYYKLNRNFILSNFLFKTPHSATCTTLGEDLNVHYHNEHAVYNRDMPDIINKIYNENKHITGLSL